MATIIDHYDSGKTIISTEHLPLRIPVPRFIHAANTPLGHKCARIIGTLGLIRKRTIIINAHQATRITL